jgi:hypothetical protein
MRVSGLFLYPVKSLGGIFVKEAHAGRRGFQHDRRYMVVDEAGRMMTQREHPQMALVRTAIEDGAIVMRHAREGERVLPLSLSEGARTQVVVWQSQVEAVVHESGGAWLSRALGLPCRLVYMPDDVLRPTKRGNEGDVVSFADGYPYLLVSQASLDGLNTRLTAPLPMMRFRPNIVVDGASAHAEDGWKRLRAGSVALRNVKPCSRCVLTTVDPDTGDRGPEPLRTLASYRAWDGQVWFGVNLIPDGEGSIRVGDPVEVLE